MRLLQLSVPANDGLDIAAQGDYVRVRSSAVDLIIENPDNGEKIEVSQGDDFEFSPFKRLRISHSSGTPQAIKLIISQGKKAGSSQIAGSVSLQGLGAGSFTQSRASLTNVNQQLLAENANRKYLLIQNNDGSAVMRVTLNGSAATASQGFRIAAGDSMELSSYNATGAINAIMETASATANNVEFAEG